MLQPACMHIRIQHRVAPQHSVAPNPLSETAHTAHTAMLTKYPETAHTVLTKYPETAHTAQHRVAPQHRVARNPLSYCSCLAPVMRGPLWLQ